jgi:isopentenyl phosphate kinase
VHGGSFGHYCEKCHVTSSFKKIRLNAGFNNQPDNVSPLTTHPPQRS